MKHGPMLANLMAYRVTQEITGTAHIAVSQMEAIHHMLLKAACRRILQKLLQPVWETGLKKNQKDLMQKHNTIIISAGLD